MKREEALKLIDALLSRTSVIADGQRAFAARYPDAPKEMVQTANFHVCVDGIDAALCWVASIELFLRDPSQGVDLGMTWHLLHHLYSWQQFEALLPLGRTGIVEHLNDVKAYLDEGAEQAARETIQDLIARLDGDVTAPSLE